MCNHTSAGHVAWCVIACNNMKTSWIRLFTQRSSETAILQYSEYAVSDRGFRQNLHGIKRSAEKEAELSVTSVRFEFGNGRIAAYTHFIDPFWPNERYKKGTFKK